MRLPGSLWSLPPWRSLKIASTWSWATCLRWSCLSSRVGSDGPRSPWQPKPSCSSEISANIKLLFFHAYCHKKTTLLYISISIYIYIYDGCVQLICDASFTFWFSFFQRLLSSLLLMHLVVAYKDASSSSCWFVINVPLLRCLPQGAEQSQYADTICCCTDYLIIFLYCPSLSFCHVVYHSCLRNSLTQTHLDLIVQHLEE